MTKIKDFNLAEKILKKSKIDNDDDNKYDVGLIEKSHKKYNLKAVTTSKMRVIDH